MGNALRRFLIGSAGILSFAGYQLYQIKSLKIEVKELKFPDLPSELEGYRICHISDLHGASFGNKNIKLAQVINALDFNIICMTGDMVHTDSDYGEAFLNLVSEITRDKVKLFVPGNHENYKRTTHGVERLNREVLYRKLANFGVKVLKNTTYQPEGLPIAFTGLDDDRAIYEDQGFKEDGFVPGDHLPMADEGCFNTVLIHRPNYFRSVADYGYDLMLSGHVHGGILRVKGLGGVLSPDIKFFPEFDKGIFRYNNAFLHVTSGLGTVKPIPKAGNRPEVVLLVLRKGDPGAIACKIVKPLAGSSQISSG